MASQQTTQIEVEGAIRERVLQVLARIHVSNSPVSAELLRKAFAEREQECVTLTLMELNQGGLIEPVQSVAVLYHGLGFVLDVEYVPGYKLTEKGVREIVFQTAASTRGEI